jgi:hypothetical protein
MVRIFLSASRDEGEEKQKAHLGPAFFLRNPRHPLEKKRMSDQKEIVRRDVEGGPALSVTVRPKPIAFLLGSGTATTIIGVTLWKGEPYMAGLFAIIFVLLGALLSGKRLA